MSPADLPPSVHDELRRAFERRDLDLVRGLFEQYPGTRTMIDAPFFPYDAPAIVHFAGAGDAGMIELLLELGADPNRRSEWWAGGFHALHSARGEVAERLLEAGAAPDACAAAHMDRPDLLEAMLADDPSRVHERGGDGQTPLHFARSRPVVDMLLLHGADPDALDVDHRATPAQWMLEQRRGAGRYELAEYLVERGASVDVFLAAALGLTDRLGSLLEADPSLMDLRTSSGAYAEQPPSSFHIYNWTLGKNLSPLQVAAQFEQDGAVEVLWAFAAPRDRLIAACTQGREQDARAVLEAHPGLLGQLGPEESRALPDAGWAGNAEAVDLMLGLGFDAAAQGQDGGTVLHCAAWQGAAGSVRAALRHERARAHIETLDPTHGSSPLGWCFHGARYRANPAGDYPEVARLLLDAGARPGPNLHDAPEPVMAAVRAWEGRGSRGEA